MSKYKREDFSNSNEVRWCPGCGDYAILAALQKLLPEIGVAPEKHVFISGIGCAGRLPYYMNTYGMHTIHGRAPAVATGLKAMREDLCVWVITGDGDALSIGANHLVHALRRNIDINILLINNEVYGLTKGQFSPTSRAGQVTRTSPSGVNVQPVNPLALALGAGASFVGRSIDKDPVHLVSVLKEAYEHKGTSFVEIYQDCNIFNNGAFDAFSLKTNRAKNTLILKEGEPLLFGDNYEQQLVLDNDNLVKVNASSSEKMIHDPTNYLNAQRLSVLQFPDFPVPLGVYYKNTRNSYMLPETIDKSLEDLNTLYKQGAYWQHS